MQLASLVWDQKARALLTELTGEPFTGHWNMTPTLLSFPFRCLASNYPKSISSIGNGTQGEVT